MNSSMNITQTARVLALTTMIVAGLAGCRGMRSSSPPVHLNPNMDNVTYLEAQEPTNLFADGRAMRPQVDGTVAQGELRDDWHLNGGANEAGEWATELPSGLDLDLDLLSRGLERYNIYCTPCHGEAGLENGGVVPVRAANSGSAWLVPSLHGERQRGYAVGRLYDIVTNGYNTMPGYRAQVPVEDRWAIAAYVRALQVQYESPQAVIPRGVRQEQGW